MLEQINQQTPPKLMYPPITDSQDENLPSFARYFQSMGLTNRQISFLYLCDKKALTEQKLQYKELEAQKILFDLKNAIIADNAKAASDPNYIRVVTIKYIEDEMKRYRDINTDASENIRKPFTGKVKQVLNDPVMVYENRIDWKTNIEYNSVSNMLLDIKREKDRKDREQEVKDVELRNFIIHCKNESVDRVADFRRRYVNEIMNMKSNYLQNRVENPDINSIKTTIIGFKLRDSIKYPRVYVTDEQVMDLLKQGTISIPNQEELIKEALLYLDQSFSTYKEDLNLILLNQNSNVIDQIKEEAKQTIETIDTSNEVDKGVNTLIVNSYTPNVVRQESSGKPIKRKWKVSDENSYDWCIRVMTNFLSIQNNSELLSGRKIWKNLDIAALASALSDLASRENGAKKFDNLTYVLDER